MLTRSAQRGKAAGSNAGTEDARDARVSDAKAAHLSDDASACQTFRHRFEPLSDGERATNPFTGKVITKVSRATDPSEPLRAGKFLQIQSYCRGVLEAIDARDALVAALVDTSALFGDARDARSRCSASDARRLDALAQEFEALLRRPLPELDVRNARAFLKSVAKDEEERARIHAGVVGVLLHKCGEQSRRIAFAYTSVNRFACNGRSAPDAVATLMTDPPEGVSDLHLLCMVEPDEADQVLPGGQKLPDGYEVLLAESAWRVIGKRRETDDADDAHTPTSSVGSLVSRLVSAGLTVVLGLLHKLLGAIAYVARTATRVLTPPVVFALVVVLVACAVLQGGGARAPVSVPASAQAPSPFSPGTDGSTAVLARVREVLLEGPLYRVRFAVAPLLKAVRGSAPSAADARSLADAATAQATAFNLRALLDRNRFLFFKRDIDSITMELTKADDALGALTEQTAADALSRTRAIQDLVKQGLVSRAYSVTLLAQLREHLPESVRAYATYDQLGTKRFFAAREEAVGRATATIELCRKTLARARPSSDDAIATRSGLWLAKRHLDALDALGVLAVQAHAGTRLDALSKTCARLQREFANIEADRYAERMDALRMAIGYVLAGATRFLARSAAGIASGLLDGAIGAVGAALTSTSGGTAAPSTAAPAFDAVQDEINASKAALSSHLRQYVASGRFRSETTASLQNMSDEELSRAVGVDYNRDINNYLTNPKTVRTPTFSANAALHSAADAGWSLDTVLKKVSVFCNDPRTLGSILASDTEEPLKAEAAERYASTCERLSASEHAPESPASDELQKHLSSSPASLAIARNIFERVALNSQWPTNNAKVDSFLSGIPEDPRFGSWSWFFSYLYSLFDNRHNRRQTDASANAYFDGMTESLISFARPFWQRQTAASTEPSSGRPGAGADAVGVTAATGTAPNFDRPKG